MVDRKIINEMLSWLRKQQYTEYKDDFHHGGFSPYPETIKAAGVVSTAKALEAIMLYSDPEGWIKDETIKDGIEFLLRVQLDSKSGEVDPIYDGGFPPMGDLELITNKAFPDATAEAVRVLAMYLARVEDISLEKRNKIRTAIYRGLRWLISYTIRGFYGDPEFNRTSLNLAIDFCFNTIPLDIFEDVAGLGIEDRMSRVHRYIKLLKQNGYLPFNLLKPENPSVTNTAEGIRLIKEITNKDHYRYEYRCEYQDEMDEWKLFMGYDLNVKIDEILEKSKDFIVRHLDQILMEDTEYDPINTKYYVEKFMSPSTYPECHSTIPAILYLAGDSEEIKEKIREKITTPIYVNRGRKEASVKSTAMLLIYNKLVNQ